MDSLLYRNIYPLSEASVKVYMSLISTRKRTYYYFCSLSDPASVSLLPNSSPFIQVHKEVAHPKTSQYIKRHYCLVLCNVFLVELVYE